MFKVGDVVSYGLHGKCMITSIEEKTVGAQQYSFYSLVALKNPIIEKTLLKTLLKDPNKILIPTLTAKEKGLRPLMTKEEAEKVILMIQDADYHFELTGPWVARQKTLEETLRKEGWPGLAKVVGYLHVLIHRDAVPHSEIQKLYESTYKILSKEISDAMGVTTKDTEPLLRRALKQKLSLDQ